MSAAHTFTQSAAAVAYTGLHRKAGAKSLLGTAGLSPQQACQGLHQHRDGAAAVILSMETKACLVGCTARLTMAEVCERSSVL